MPDPTASHPALLQREPLLASLALIIPSLSATPAFAYVGPGAGLTAMGTTLAVLLVILLAVIGFIWYPLKRIIRKRRTARAAEDDSQGPE